MRTVNLGILAHVDAGKTSLTERLLYAAGVIDELGSVDEGNTRTDTLALERQRGITIKAAVVSFAVDGVTVNLIDTPGHPDFIAEIERVLGVLDGAVLVLSAVEGVQAQSRVLMRTLQRLRIPTLLFVNKIDRMGARSDGVLREIAAALTPAIVPMGIVRAAGTRAAVFTPFDAGDPAFRAVLAARLAEHDEDLLAAFVGGADIPSCRLRGALAAQTRRALVHPLFCGSALTGAGVDALLAGIPALLPAVDSDEDGPPAGTVFKVERGPAGEQIAYVRLFSGTVRTRDRVQLRGEDRRTVTAISVFKRGADVSAVSAVAGEIAKLWGLGDVRIGDTLGVQPAGATPRQFASPALAAVVVPRHAADRGALQVALARLAEQDPLINLRLDGVRHELSVSLYGEVQKEVVQAMLAADFGLEVEFRDTTTICVERPADCGAAVAVMRGEGNPFLATVGLRVEPAPLDAGVSFTVAGEVLGTMPLAFFKAVESSVQETLQEGLYGWRVTDCTVTLTHSGYAPRGSHAHQGFSKSMSSTGADFRGLTPLVLMEALLQAGTRVYEPLHRFRLEVPADTFGALVPVLARLRAVAHTQAPRGATYLLEGEIPAARVHELQLLLPGLGRGEGVLESAFARYAPVHDTPPTRPRTDHNPLKRKEYLLHVARRV